jgi:glycosyltransferase involved in cell wall biosynthesis
LGGLPFQTGLFGGADLRRRLRRLAREADVVVLQTARLAGHAGDVGSTPLVVDFIDSLALNLGRRAVLDRPWLRRLWRHEAARLARAEARLMAAARRAAVVCARDRDRLAGGLRPADRLRVEVIPIAVAADPGSGEAAAGPPVVAFTGNLGYFVNADAARWLLREVWPQVHVRRPDARLLVAGDRPGPSLRRAARLPGVELRAGPQELRPLLAGATVAVAPLRCGSGQPMKVLEAWAAGVPVLSTAWGLAGTTGQPGVEAEVAADPGDWVETILRLLDDGALRAQLAAAGRRRLLADYSPEVVAAAWRDLLAAAVS